MPTKSIPEDDHVVRYCRPNWLVANGDKVTVIPQAFMLREKEPYLSISWLERQAGDRSTRLKDLVQRTRVKFKNAHMQSGKARSAANGLKRPIHTPMKWVRGLDHFKSA